MFGQDLAKLNNGQDRIVKQPCFEFSLTNVHVHIQSTLTKMSTYLLTMSSDAKHGLPSDYFSSGVFSEHYAYEWI